MMAARLLPALLACAAAVHAGEAGTAVPAPTDADRAAAAAAAAHEFHDNDVHGMLLWNHLEYVQDHGPALAWDVRGWLGTDLDRLWLRSEGDRADGRFGSADAELLYGHSVSAWWDVLAGVRHDFRPGDGRTWAALGLQGPAPLGFDVSATAYAGGGGTAARLQIEYALLFTNRLILQPELNLWLHGSEDPMRELGSGISTGEAALRLRYEFTRRFAPYLGIEWERALGATASLRRAADTGAGSTRLVLGVRTWF